tara:strand:- start:49 stop:171 length:123 start_codon:yes stop_codon:yes gene_type:complete
VKLKGAKLNTAKLPSKNGAKKITKNLLLIKFVNLKSYIIF